MKLSRRNKSGKHRRVLAANARNAAFGNLTHQQQLAALDERLGVGIGATKQRAKLAAKIKASMSTKTGG